MHGAPNRKFIVIVLREARIATRLGNWAKADAMIRECRDWTRHRPKHVTSRQVENCISMMCKYRVRKESIRIR